MKRWTLQVEGIPGVVTLMATNDFLNQVVAAAKRRGWTVIIGAAQ